MLDPGSAFRLILRYLSTTQNRLDLVSDKLEILMKRTELLYLTDTEMSTTGCNETFAPARPRSVEEERDLLRTFQQLNRGIVQRTLVNMDIVNELLERTYEETAGSRQREISS